MVIAVTMAKIPAVTMVTTPSNHGNHPQVTWDDTNKILTMEVEKSPSEKVNEYTCFINSTESSVTTQHSAKPYINTIGGLLC